MDPKETEKAFREHIEKLMSQEIYEGHTEDQHTKIDDNKDNEMLTNTQGQQVAQDDSDEEGEAYPLQINPSKTDLAIFDNAQIQDIKIFNEAVNLLPPGVSPEKGLMMAKRLSAQLEDEKYQRGRVAAQSAEARNILQKYNNEEVFNTPTSPIMEMARMNVLHVHDRLKRALNEMKQIKEEVMTCHKHHEVSMPAIVKCRLTKAHGDNVILALMNEMGETTKIIMNEMEKFHSNYDVDKRSRYDIASPIGTYLAKTFDEVMETLGIQLPPPIMTIAFQ